MGNCHKKDQTVTVTNFDSDKWGTNVTNIHAECFLLKNYYHPNVKLFKWISSYYKPNHISKWRGEQNSQFLPNIYESGTIKNTDKNSSNSQNPNADSKLYIITE